MPEERKLVTLLFADVTGSTAMGEELDPEDVRALMGRYYTTARSVIEAHGGTLEKFIGDAVMAIFGLPQAHEDDAERALASALALRSSIEGDSVLQGRVILRMGVNTGEVVATRERTEDFLVTGDAVNVAARLQQCAEAGEILASERTRSAARQSFEFGPDREVEVKGKSDPLHVFPLQGRRAVTQHARTPLVGRKQDLAQLELLRERALEEERPQLVSIIAPAGTGKTRLLEEFLARTSEEGSFHAATARCLPYGQTMAYWPLRGLLDELLDAGVSREALIDAFLAGGDSREEAERLSALVLKTVGEDTDVESDRQLIFNAWRLLIEAVSKASPRIVVFEDLHWAGDSLLDLVEHVMHPRTRAALLIIGLSRAELLDRRPTWGAGQRNFTALTLDPLSDRQVRELIESLGGHLSTEIEERIVERSGGNPFFAGELVRGLAERGVTGHGRERDALPDTVHAAVLARLDGLPSPQRSVLQAASVAGKTFQPDIVVALREDMTSTEVASAIDELLVRDDIVPEGKGAFAFRHILIRDVAYGTLSRADRARMHARAAQWLETVMAHDLDEVVELVAYHYREAITLARQAAVPLSLELDEQRALAALERAGELAGPAGAMAEARGYLKSALEVAPEEEQARLFEKAGDIAPVGDTGLASYQEALRRWRLRESRNPLEGARLLRKILIILTRWQGSVSTRPSEEELADMFKEAGSLVEKAGDEDEKWRIRVAALFRPFWRGTSEPGELEEIERVGSEAADYFEQREDWPFFNAALDGLSVVGVFGKHEVNERAARRRLAAPSNRFERGDAIYTLVLALFAQGDHAGALETMQAEVERARANEPITFLANGLAATSLLAFYVGRWDLVESLSSLMSRGWEEMGRDPSARFLRQGFVSRLLLATAREDRAAIDSATSVLELLGAPCLSPPINQLYLDAMRSDDVVPMAQFLEAVIDTLRTAGSPYTYAVPAMFLTERGHILEEEKEKWLEEYSGENNLAYVRRIATVNGALRRGDFARLREAIDDVESSGFLPYAARLRIVLAEKSGDAKQLDLARPVLESLGDLQGLGRLREVEGALEATSS